MTARNVCSWCRLADRLGHGIGRREQPVGRAGSHGLQILLQPTGQNPGLEDPIGRVTVGGKPSGRGVQQAQQTGPFDVEPQRPAISAARVEMAQELAANSDQFCSDVFEPGGSARSAASHRNSVDQNEESQSASCSEVRDTPPSALGGSAQDPQRPVLLVCRRRRRGDPASSTDAFADVAAATTGMVGGVVA